MTTHKGSILLVDSDLASRDVIDQMLRQAGFVLEKAASDEEAIKTIQEKDPAYFQCVINSYSPLAAKKEGNFSLFEWIKGVDNALSVIMLSEQTQNEVLHQALQKGFSDFLSKPVSASVLIEATERACGKTIQMRRLNTAEKNIRAVAQTNNLFKSILVPELLPQLQVHHTPFDQVGGDFVNVLPIGKNKSLLLLGDVSGHDLRAGFVSTYFQGLVRGICRSGKSIMEACQSFNDILIKEWRRRSETDISGKIEPRTSLSLLAVELDLEKNRATVVNCGAPGLSIAFKNGSPGKVDSQNMPLGWNNTDPIQSTEIHLDNVSYLFLATDGLQDWAEKLGQSQMGLAYRLLQKRSSPGGTPPDDLLVLRYQHDKETSSEELWHPLGSADGKNKDTSELAIELCRLIKMNARTRTESHITATEVLEAPLKSYKNEIAECSVAMRPKDEALKLITRFANGELEEVAL